MKTARITVAMGIAMALSTMASADEADPKPDAPKLVQAARAAAKKVQASRPEDVHASFKAFFEAGDLDGLSSLFEPTAVLKTSPDAPAVRGLDAIRDVLKSYLAPGVVMETYESEVLQAGDLAFVRTKWRMTGTVSMEGTSQEVMRRQADGRWLYVIDMPQVR
jgi:ketosteroid isomerase-like protein